MESQRLTPRPIGTRVLVRQDPPKELSTLIVAPDSAGKDYPPTGTVVAVGAQNEDVRPGDRVLFKRRPSSALIQDDRIPDQHDPWRGLIMLYAEDILAVMEES